MIRTGKEKTRVETQLQEMANLASRKNALCLLLYDKNE